MRKIPGSKVRLDDKRIGLDTIRVTPDEATELCAHHLQLAAMYFEATPTDFKAVKEEVNRILSDRIGAGYVSPAQIGASAFLQAIETYYNGLENKNEDFDS